MSARDELREYADRYGYTAHVNALIDALVAEVRAADIALIEGRADDADFTEEPLYIVGLRSAADLLKTTPAPTPVESAGDETGEACGSLPCDAETGEPCDRHERKQAHAEGEHAFCGSECDDTTGGAS